MHNKNLFQMLRLLSAEEFKELGKFLASPYCNPNKRLPNYHEALAKFHPNFETMRMTPEDLFKKIFPEEGKVFNAAELRALDSDLRKKLNDFLAFNELKNNDVLKAKLTVISLSQKDNYSLFAEKVEGFIKHRQEKKVQDLSYYLDLFEMNRQLFFHPQTKKNKAKVVSLEQTVANLDKFFILAKLRLTAEQLSRSFFLDEKPQITFLKLTRQEGINYQSENRLFTIYHNAVQIQLDMEDEAAFHDLKKDFFKYAESLSKEEQNEIYPYLTNFATRQSNLGNEKYDREKFELLLRWLQSGHLIENNRFPDGIFLGIVNLGCLLGELNWVENFIRDYQKYLSIQELELNLTLSQIELLFARKQFTEVIHQLSLFKTKDLGWTMMVKRRTIQCYLEKYLLGDFKEDALILNVEAFEQYLRRDKTFSSNFILAHKRFCKAIKQLVFALSLEPKPRIEIIKEIKALLSERVAIACRKWLYEKLEGL